MKYGIKLIGNTAYNGGINCVQTERGFEKWVASNGLVSDWPKLPPLSFDDINAAYRFKETNRYDDIPKWYHLVEEIQ